MKTIGLASDHAGFPIKEYVKNLLISRGIDVKDYGTYSLDSCDYPDFGHALARGMEDGDCQIGIAVCGSGEGISMTLNKHAIIRAALVWMPEIAALARQHNDANVLVLPGRFVSEEQARQIVDTFLETPYEGGRPQRRIEKIPL